MKDGSPSFHSFHIAFCEIPGNKLMSVHVRRHSRSRAFKVYRRGVQNGQKIIESVLLDPVQFDRTLILRVVRNEFSCKD